MERDKENRVVVNDPIDWNDLTESQLNAKLLLACTVRDLSVARQAIDHGADVNCRGSDFLTPFHVAAEHGDVRLMRLLCTSSNVRPEAKTMHGLTPLHTAATLGHSPVIIELLKSGATLDCEDNLGRSPLHHAVLQNDHECARFLMRSGARVHAYDAFEESPVYISALKTKDVVMIKLLLGYRLRQTPFPPEESQRLLLEAVLSARNEYDLEIVKTIVHYGGEIVNLCDPISRRTPLHVVALTGYRKLAEYLIENGADLHAKNRANQTALQVALNCKNTKIVRLLDRRLREIDDDSSEDKS